MLDSASSAGGRFPRPLHSFRCAECGYGARARTAPERCPMCGASAWEAEPWRPFSALHRDLLGRRRRGSAPESRPDPARTRVLEQARAGERRRELNDRIATLTRSLSQPRETLVEFVCECEHGDCDSVLRLTLEEYAAFRSDEGYVAVVPGHQAHDVTLVAYTERYVLAAPAD